MLSLNVKPFLNVHVSKYTTLFSVCLSVSHTILLGNTRRVNVSGKCVWEYKNVLLFFPPPSSSACVCVCACHACSDLLLCISQWDLFNWGIIVEFDNYLLMLAFHFLCFFVNNKFIHFFGVLLFVFLPNKQKIYRKTSPIKTFSTKLKELTLTKHILFKTKVNMYMQDASRVLTANKHICQHFCLKYSADTTGIHIST